MYAPQYIHILKYLYAPTPFFIGFLFQSQRKLLGLLSMLETLGDYTNQALINKNYQLTWMALRYTFWRAKGC